MYLENANDLNNIVQKIYDVTGFSAKHYRLSTLKRRLQLRLHATNTKSYREYLSLLKQDSSESHRFLKVFTVNVSDFFRDKRIFLSLKENVLPGILKKIKKQKRKRMRIWSIGCSKGQESYSIAIILKEIIKNKYRDVKIMIHATDINREVLNQAIRAQYKKSEVKNIPRKYLNKYFKKMKTDEFRINDNIRKLVRFKHHDFIKGKSLGKFDLILCRNLFIFLEPQFQEKMFKKIYSSLKNEGILVLGTAEAPKIENFFSYISPKNHIYQKII
ncbi:MAG: protein-glutamate O-methyltransferase CheR [Candidatus Aminicenantaceae bacterium]